ncbi:hypothetical protein [Virgibacillus dokdonensis]|uniref:Uncharacterized protein n=1 Tax=Virgibacillus dokdonensis TaxID=302167 RepID=A0A2K9J3P3_9BACI|nr:hypothetical protein [Virgibacillus dokdonensis]AUJ26582.1 hypothetical protein A21D_03548 [Virgibacillus dokdonensis]
MGDKERLENVKRNYEDDAEIAEYAGVTLTLDDYFFLLEQAKRALKYRAYLESIRMTGTYGRNINTNEVLRSDEAKLADEALGDNHIEFEKIKEHFEGR